jgi:hypothetical protein
MNPSFLRNSLIAAAAIGGLHFMALSAYAQATAPAAAAHPAAAAAAAVDAPTPRTADGHPDLNGVWKHAQFQGAYTALKPGQSLDLAHGQLAGRGPGAGPAPARMAPILPSYKPEFVAKVKDLDTRQVQEDNTLRCWPPGVPRLGPPHKIVEDGKSKEIVFLYGDVNGEFYRIIPTDNRPHDPDAEPSFNGDSVGHWEGDTLVVDSTNFVDDTWLGDNGLFHSTDMHVVERLTRKGDVLTYQLQVDDPKVLTQPWIPAPRILPLQHDELEQANPCIDRDMDHLRDLSHHGNAR